MLLLRCPLRPHRLQGLRGLQSSQEARQGSPQGTAQQAQAREGGSQVAFHKCLRCGQMTADWLGGEWDEDSGAWTCRECARKQAQADRMEDEEEWSEEMPS